MTDLQTAHEAYRREACELCRDGVRRLDYKPSHEILENNRYIRHLCKALLLPEWADQRDKVLRVENERLQKALDEKLTTGVESPETNTPIRMHLALKMLRAWNSGTEGYDSSVLLVVNEWIDGGMKGPIPWPDSPFFAEWAAKSGLSNVSGNVGFRFMATILPVVGSPAQESVKEPV